MSNHRPLPADFDTIQCYFQKFQVSHWWLWKLQIQEQGDGSLGHWSYYWSTVEIALHDFSSLKLLNPASVGSTYREAFPRHNGQRRPSPFRKSRHHNPCNLLSQVPGRKELIPQHLIFLRKTNFWRLDLLKGGWTISFQTLPPKKKKHLKNNFAKSGLSFCKNENHHYRRHTSCRSFEHNLRRCPALWASENLPGPHKEKRLWFH